MPRRRRAPLLLGVLSLNVGLSLAGTVQPSNLNSKLPSDASTHKQVVKDAFFEAYTDWQLYAGGADDLAPLSPGYGTNPRNGWGATTVDALGTMKIMGLDVCMLSPFCLWYEGCMLNLLSCCRTCLPRRYRISVKSTSLRVVRGPMFRTSHISSPSFYYVNQLSFHHAPIYFYRFVSHLTLLR